MTDEFTDHDQKICGILYEKYTTLEKMLEAQQNGLLTNEENILISKVFTKYFFATELHNQQIRKNLKSFKFNELNNFGNSVNYDLPTEK